MRIDEELNILEKYRISPDELFVLKTVILAKEGETKYLQKLLTLNVIDFRENLVSLQDKEILLKSYKIPEKGNRFIIEDVLINKNVIKNYHKSSFDMGEELFMAYPAFVTIGETTYGLRNIAKKFDSLEDFYYFYAKSINFDAVKHAEIMNLLEWAQKNTNFMNFSLIEFVISHKWLEIQLIKDGHGSNINFNTVTSI